MRFITIYILLSLLMLSCVLKPKNKLVKTSNDDTTYKFDYIYVEALKNKMLSRNELAKKQFKECLSINPESTASAYQIASLMYKEHNYTEAKKYAEFCLKHKPKNEWYLLLRAKIARELDNNKVYNKIYEQLASSNPNNLEYNYKFAFICYKNNDLHRALSLLNDMQDQLGVNETVSFLKNSIYYKQKKYNLIAIELKSLFKTYPDSTKYAYMLAEFYAKSNRIEKAIYLFNSTLNKDSTNTNVQIALAWLYAETGIYAKGFPYLIKVLPNKSIGFDRKYKVANLYIDAYSDGLSEDSIQKIYELLAANKDYNDTFLSKYVKYLYAKKDLNNAEEYSLLAIKKFPGNYDLWNLYFDILITMNRYDDLNEYSIKCLEYFPNKAVVYFYCGYSHCLLKQYNKALEFLKTSIDYSPDNEELILQNYLLMAESYHNLGKHRESDKYFDKYLQIDSGNANLMNNYAYYLLQRGINYEKALQLSRKSLEIEPRHCSFLDTYAWILFAQKKYKEALSYIERAYKYDGDKSATIIDHYGDIYSKLGKHEEANDMWQEAYRISKSKKILEKIKNN